MYTITAPITIGQSGSDVQNLQDVLLFLVQKGDIFLTNNFPLTNLHQERLESFFGDTTAACVELFCQQHQLQSNPQELVDNSVAASLNSFLSQYPESNQELITITGIVSHISGNSLPTNYTVRLEQVLFDSNISLGTTQINNLGEYTFSVLTSALTTTGERYAFKVVVIITQNEEYSSKIEYIHLSQRKSIINVVLETNLAINSEYTTVKTKVEALIGQTEIHNITIEGENPQSHFLIKNTNESSKEINALVWAHKLSVQLSDLNPELFYGIIRQNLPSIAEQLLFQTNKTIKSSIKISIENNIIQAFSEQQVDDFVNSLKGTIVTRWNADNATDLSKTITFRIYNAVLNNTALTNEFLSIFYNYEGDVQADTFWKHLEVAYQSFDTHLKKLKAVTVIAAIVGNNPALVASLLAILNGSAFSNNQTLPIVQGEPQPELLAGISLANWTDIITAAKQQDANNFLFPIYVEGQNDQQKIAFYADRLLDNFTSIYTIYSIKAKITTDQNSPFPELKSKLNTFLNNNIGFDIRALSVLALKNTENNPYDLTGIQNITEFTEEISTVQRLSALTSSYEAMASMAENGIVSAFHVTRMGRAEFAETYESELGSTEKAFGVYDTADSIITHVIGKAYEVYGGATYEATPWTGVAEAGIPIGGSPSAPLDPYAEWRVLFGPLDGCTCCHCESVYSPSAYLVDNLHFLKKESAVAHNLLMSRRPDIRGIELTCDNSNIPIPYIDMVNELLEDLVSTGITYPRQTKLSGDYQKAIPEYFNSSGYYHVDLGGVTGAPIDSPYPKLKNASYPWTLPYNVYKRQIDTHLSIPGIQGFEMVQRFSNKDLSNSLDDVQFCTNYLNISNELRTIITTASTLTAGLYKDLQVHYGLTVSTTSSLFRITIPNPQRRGDFITLDEATWITSLTNRVDVFLQQTKLSYRDLLELLDCYYINPLETTTPSVSRKFAILNNDTTLDIATCNLYELKIHPAHSTDLPPFMDRVHRFVRLAKALGWHFYELDRALRAIGGNEISMASFKKLAQLKYLADALNINIEDACTLFQDIETLPYRDYRHEDEDCELIDIPNQYTRIFKNPVLANANLNNLFPITPFSSTAPYAFSVIEVDKFCNLISGIIQLSSDDTEILLDEVYDKYSSAISTPSGKKSILPNISILSYIYRQSLLIKSLKLSIKEWSFYVQWISNNNYFGNISADPANNTAAKPISMFASSVSPYTAIPFDAIRFCSTLRLFKNAGFKTADLEYLLLDKATDTIVDDRQNTYLASILTDLRTDLRKKWYPTFSSTSTNASNELLKILAEMIDEQDAKQLMSILDRVLDSSPEYTVQEYDFINEKMLSLLPSGSADILANTGASGIYLTVLSDRYDYVYNHIKIYNENSQLRPAVLNALAKSFKLGEETVQLLLNEVIEVSTVNGFDLILDSDFVNSTYTITRWVNATDQFKVVLQLHKASLLVSKFNLGSQDIQYLWVNKIISTSTSVIEEIPLIHKLPIRSARDTVFVPGTNSETTLRLLRNLLQWMQIRAFTGSDINILFKAIEENSDIVASMSALFKLSSIDINTLIIDPPTTGSTDKGCLDIETDQYRNPISYLRIIDCLEMQYLLPAPMRTLFAVASATRTAENQNDAAEIIHLVKAPYNDKQWLEVIKPISDLLRVERRDALIDFLLAYPVPSYQYHWLTSNDIYETLMVDVEMMPIMSTTRILLAINTVQLWMDRVLLQIEAVTVNATVARQWTMWRKLYRVWEANRKVFLYPENWIEPELRDDKTPLFLELEKFLKQNEVTKDNVEQAYKTYLERLDQLSRLDIIGIYRETDQPYQESLPNENNVVHAFGRTKEYPHLYHYRRRVGGVWSPWEKMDVQIEGDHFIPVMWRGRLRFYWLVFSKDQEEVPMSSIQSEGSYEMPAGVRWKIDLAWTELKDGKWIGKQMSKESVYSRFVYEEIPINRTHATLYSSGGNYKSKNRVWNEKGDLERIKKESIVFVCNPNNNGSPSFSVIERDYGINRDQLSNKITEIEWGVRTGSLTKLSDELKIRINKVSFERLKTWLDLDFEWVTDTYNRYWTHLGQFIVKFNGVSLQANPDSGAVIPSLYMDYAATPAAAKRDLQSNRAGYWPNNTDYLYSRPHHLGYAHFPDGNVKLLDAGPGHYFNEEPLSVPLPEYSIGKTWVLRNRYQAKYLVFPRKVPDNFVENTPIQIPYFFYKDNKNTFFVEKVSLFYKGYELSSPMGPVPMFGEISAKEDSVSGTGISLGAGVASADYDLVRPEADVISFGTEGSSMESIKGYYKAAYRFHNFAHERVDEFLEILHREGLDGLLKRDFISSIPDSMDFAGIYKPTVNVHGGVYYPHNKVDFSPEGAYSMYNWELFFHIPMLIANKLSQNQQFDEARKWYHYVFNPTSTTPAKVVNRFWNFVPFFDKASEIVTIDSIMKSASLSSAIDRWANDPFKPHLIARTRPSAYMKNTVMKYLDNLIAWADHKFRSDSREAINEATLLYILALQILGRKPETIPARAKPFVQTYGSLDASGALNDFGNAMVAIENVLLSSGAERHRSKKIIRKATAFTKEIAIYYDISLIGSMYYFCTPPNEKLLQYWEILADRLFKIRNSQSIDGVTRELALYDPPIDPAILVKAAASGVSLSGILGDLNAPLPSYRFNVISQKASELVNEVKSLGGQLLSALEKKDAEQISLLRTSQEIKVLEAITDLKEKAIQESKTQWEVLKVQLKSTKQRQSHYGNLIENGLNVGETLQLVSLGLSIPLQIAQGITQGIGGAVAAIPQAHSTLPGVEVGGVQASSPVMSAASVIGIAAGVNNTIGSMSGILGGHARRKQDWELQYKLATIEVEQMNKQLIASEIRYAMAQVELRNHQIQMSNAQEMEIAMRDKYTNEELYDWMIGQISFVYFQGYKLAYDTAKKAERCFLYELNLDTSDYIQYGYWDSLKKGLLAGENLAYDLKRMEVAYLDKNKRQLELTKHISVAALNPEALMNLRNNRSCEIDIPEWLYDMDYPGQHMRRIKSVSISIPCVAGPYTTISCKLSLTKSKYRKSPYLAAGGVYEEGTSDNRFTYMFGNIQSIATSSGQNDSGMFEMNFRDERYLPFEGCGAISTWAIELPAAYAQFDYKSISDVIIHIKYTALDSGAMKVKAKEAIDALLAAASTPGQGLYRIFDLKHEFSNEWHQLLNQVGDKKMLLGKIRERLPYLVQNEEIALTIEDAKLFADKDFDVKFKQSTATPTTWDGGSSAGTNAWKATLALTDTSINDDPFYLHFKSDTPISSMKECWLLIHYKLS